ncbi:histidine--tRNA ligase [soil metagenome]
MQNVQTLKGFRDFLPKEAKKRAYVINTLKTVFSSFGFEPLETPALEYEEILMGKYGEEGDKLMYRFTDNGDRRVALRYDQTVPLSRVVAQYQNDLPFPFKRYQIQPVWRAENTQKGRFREFLQCDIDTVGTKSTLADAEILAVIAKAFTTLGFSKFTLLINDRANFKGLPTKAITSIDKLKKIGAENVKKELQEIGVAPETLDALLDLKPTPYLQEVLDTAEQFGVMKDMLSFDPTLARGLDYYTGIIIEVEIEGYTVGSVGGGGRYDELIGMFSKTAYPAVGFAFGFDRIMDAMTEQDLFPLSTEEASAKVLVTVFSKEYESSSFSVLSRLQTLGIATEMYVGTQGMDKQLKYASEKNIPYVIIIGENEVQGNKVTIKDMRTREQKTVPINELTENIK